MFPLRTNEDHDNIHLVTKLPDISIFRFEFHKCIICNLIQCSNKMQNITVNCNLLHAQ